MKIPTLQEAREMLAWADSCNPGPWAAHSKAVAGAARKIAQVSGLDGDTAEVLGLLHDLGRYTGPTAMLHIYDGYLHLKKKAYEDAAQICITHSFPVQKIDYYIGANDCSEAVYEEIREVLDNAVYTDYDRLIQLCDSICLPEGVCLLEKRLLDVAMRHGVKDTTVENWRAIYKIWQYFEEKSGRNLYTLFDDVVENTFGIKM